MNGTSTRNDTGASGKRSEVAVILGAQWGDEGKGKIVDLLCQRADVVCRCQVCNVFSWREGYGNLLSYRYSCQQVSSLCQFASRHFALRPGYFAPGSFPIGTDRHQGKAICPKMEGDWTFRSQDVSFLGTKHKFWTFRSLDVSFLGRFVPWMFRS